MRTYVVLLRGINVGGKNKIPMARLREVLSDELGYEAVSTYIASGNAVLRSNESASTVASRIEGALPQHFALDVDVVRVKVLTIAQLRAVIAKRPPGFGDSPDTYHSDAIFLLDVTPAAALRVFNPREGVDVVTAGTGVIYSQRLSAERTRSRLGAIAGTPIYPQLTIRNWNTTTKLLELALATEAATTA